MISIGRPETGPRGTAGTGRGYHAHYGRLGWPQENYDQGRNRFQQDHEIAQGRILTSL
jgi:hypothetical protein